MCPCCADGDPSWVCLPMVQNQPCLAAYVCSGTGCVSLFPSHPSLKTRCTCRVTSKLFSAQTGFLRYLRCWDMQICPLYFGNGSVSMCFPGKACSPWALVVAGSSLSNMTWQSVALCLLLLCTCCVFGYREENVTCHYDGLYWTALGNWWFGFKRCWAPCFTLNLRRPKL